MANELGQAKYNDPINGSPATIGGQYVNSYFWKQALIEARKLQFFMQLADVTAMPKHFGKTIKRFHYMPLLDDRNVNDQGIDANGVSISNGNLYGSSKDVGTITGKLPLLSETGGRVNRVGFKRKELQGSIEKFGFFDEYTQESVDFDNDSELQQHISREMLNGAHEMTEDALMVDIVNSAGVLRYAGSATSKATVKATDLVTYADFMRLNIDLDNNRCPKQTTISTGTRMIDTKTIPAARAMYTATEMIPTLKAMKDLHNNQAFIPVERYAAGTTTMTGEIGMIDQFRIIIHPEMVRWNGAGAATADGSVYSTNGKVDVFPMIVVGEQSFTTIGFQTDGNTVKFKITHKAPGDQTANQLDPYGETGFMSIKWYYGFMVLRPERLAVLHTAAKF